jgi:hypothetical protein
MELAGTFVVEEQAFEIHDSISEDADRTSPSGLSSVDELI